MTRYARRSAAAVAAYLLAAFGAHATVISSRAKLDALLGGGETTASFGSILPTSDPELPGDEQYAAIVGDLSSATIIPASLFQSRQGPGLVPSGIDFSAPATGILLVQYGAVIAGPALVPGYSESLVIGFTAPVDAFGFDLTAHIASLPLGAQVDTATVFDTNGNQLSQASFDPSTDVSVFFGDQEPVDVGKVEIVGQGGLFVPLNDVSYGSIPEPPSLALFAPFLFFALRRRNSRDSRWRA
jgi:hypothetical protein